MCDVAKSSDDCPSVASACSGADARLADKAQMDLTSKANPTYAYSKLVVCPAEAAVSPRSSDGPAWLSEWRSQIKKEYEFLIGPNRRYAAPYDRGVADGLDIAETMLDRLLSQAIAKNNTDESRDG